MVAEFPIKTNWDDTKEVPIFIPPEWQGIFQWEPNNPFTATLRIVSSTEKGARLQDVDTEIFYPISSNTLVNTIMHCPVIDGCITGTWIIEKRGQSYGVRMYGT